MHKTRRKGIKFCREEVNIRFAVKELTFAVKKLSFVVDKLTFAVEKLTFAVEKLTFAVPLWATVLISRNTSKPQVNETVGQI